jgi:hypothetical protein
VRSVGDRLTTNPEEQKEELVTQKRISNRLVDLIDIVFGVVVAVNFAMLFTESPFKTLPSIGQVITLPHMSLTVAYAAIILSWVGYHQMIEYNPYILNRWGYGRFSFDVIIVFMYTILMYSTQNTGFYLACYPIIFLMYAIGGVIRNKEYKDKVSWPKGSITYTLYFSLVLAVWFIWGFLTSLYSFLNAVPLTWILIVVILFLNLHYRYERAKKGFIRKN